MIRPPDVHERWEDNNWWIQSSLLAYNQIREYEEFKRDEVFLSVPRIF